MTKLIWFCVSDVIEEFIKSGNEIEAIHIAHEAGLLERFPPVPLLKSYIKRITNKTQVALRGGRHSNSVVVRLSIPFPSQYIFLLLFCA
jgi:activator of 2-hydroxyglutaryl-CoA dehydratase